MNFSEYKELMLSSAIQNKEENETEWRALLRLCADSLKAYLGFNSLTVSPIEDTHCPFDLWGISHKTLYLIKVDDAAFDRADETVSQAEVSSLFEKLGKFVRAASSAIGFSDHQNTRAIIAELLSRLAHGESDQSIEQIKMMPFFLNPIDGRCTQERHMHIQLLKCSAQPLSLQTIWQQGIELPEITIKAIDGIKAEEEEKTNEFFDDAINIQKNEPSNAETFRQDFVSQAHQQKGLSSYNLFEQISDLLIQVGQYDEIAPAYCTERSYSNKPFAVHGFSFDEINNAWTLFLLDPNDGDSGFGKQDIERCSRRVLNFIELSCKGLLYDSVLDVNTEEGSLSYNLFSKYRSGEIGRFEVVVLTMRRKNFKNNPDETVCVNLPCRIKILDYADLYQMSESLQNQLISIDFTDQQFGGKPIPLISAISRPDIGYQAFVGKISAEVLSSIYDEYGQKVLSSNVRAFLLTQGKVNKGIQKTIKEEPENFFAFNNGICVVASSIRQEDRSGITLMNGATDFQIVNGGQTTASLHYALKKKIPISNIFVPIKLSVVPEDNDDFNRDVFVQKISAYANSQNKVSDSDLGTNTQFQILFQKMGDKAMFVSRDGSVCKWYYERARGAYRIEKLRTKSGSSKNQIFTKRYPQKFDKLDLAKWLKAWGDEPFIANLGGQKCFIDFSKDLIKKEEKDGLDFCTTDFFKYAVGKGILFRHIDLLVANSDWYQSERSYKINIVGYTMGLLRQTFNTMFPGQEIDFLRLWKEQRVPGVDDKIKTFDPLAKESADLLDPVITKLARFARSIFDDENRSVSDVGEWVKKPECWQMMSSRIPSLEEYRNELKTLCCSIPAQYQIKSWREK